MIISWQLLLSIRIVLTDILGAYLIKTTADSLSRPRKLGIQYGLVVLMAFACYALFGKEDSTLPDIPLILLAGIFNALGCYAQWRAIAISQSKFAIFDTATTALTVLLALLLLGEASILTPPLMAGITLLLVSACLLAFKKSKTKGTSEFMLWMLAQIAIFTLIILFTKHLAAAKQVSRWSFLFYYYLGSAVGALFVIKLASKNETGPKVGVKGWIKLLPLASVIFGSMLLYYWILETAPLSIVQPVFKVSSLVFPFLMGQLYFKEHRSFSGKDWLGCALGLAGALLISLQ